MNEGKFPEKLKLSYVTPIFRAGKRNDVSNYRSVSVVSTLARVFEKIIIKKYELNLNSCISQEQHGFVKNRSTVTNLIETTTFIADALERKNRIDIVYLDFEKAFDSVDHLILLRNIGRVVFKRNMIKWFYSFLINRKCHVKIGNAISSDYTPKSGVPAGCSLSSYLFNIFIDDITRLQTENVKFELFADDVKLISEIYDQRNYYYMQNVLDKVNDWSEQNRLKMNVKKVKLLSISRMMPAFDFE